MDITSALNIAVSYEHEALAQHGKLLFATYPIKRKSKFCWQWHRFAGCWWYNRAPEMAMYKWRMQGAIAWNPACCWIYSLLFADDFIMIRSDFIKSCNLAAFSPLAAWRAAGSACAWEPVHYLPKALSGLQVLWKQESESLVDILSITQNHNLIGSLFITLTVA